MNDASNTRRGAEVVQVVATIKERLRAGRYAPGHRLIEQALMTDLGTTRAVVREALRWLAAEDLIEIEPYRGASVSGLSRKDVDEIYDVLEPLSIFTARRAAELIDVGGNRAMAEESLAATRRFNELVTSGRRLPDLANENVRFHRVLYEIVGNPRISRICEQMELQLVRILHPSIVINEHPERWTAHHEGILVRVLEGNGDKAAGEMKKFARMSRKAVQSLPDSFFS